MHKLNYFVKYLFTLCFCLLTISIFSSSVSAQSAADIDFTVSVDKTAIIPGDSFNITYVIKNNSPTFPAYNLNIKFPYIDQLANVAFLGSSTGISTNTLKTTGYNLASLSASKSLTIVLNFQSDTSLATGQKVQNKLTGIGSVVTTLIYHFASGSSAPDYTKDVSFPLPDVTAPKPAIVSLKYPSGVSGFDLSTLDANSAKSVSGFYIEALNKITFIDPLDLSTPEALATLTDFTKNFDINNNGYVSYPSNNTFNKKSNIELRQINFFSPPLLFQNDQKSTIPSTYDSKSQLMKFSVPNAGKYTAVGETQLTFPNPITSKIVTLTGKVTDPNSRVEILIGDKKVSGIIIDISTGNFTTNLNFTNSGTQDVYINTIARNGIVNKQIVSVVVIVTDLSVPSVTTVEAYKPKDDKTFLNSFIYALIGIAIVGILLFIFLVFLTFHKRKMKKNEEFVSQPKKYSTSFIPESSSDSDVSDLKTKNIDDHDNIKYNSSENRHEVIRAKVADRLKMDNSDRDDDFIAEIHDVNSSISDGVVSSDYQSAEAIAQEENEVPEILNIKKQKK